MATLALGNIYLRECPFADCLLKEVAIVSIRSFFAGSNSGEGFYSLFDHIIGPRANRIYLLKGGPGTGKSYFMKAIALGLRDVGIDQELFYCSSDPSSLDAVSFPCLGVALIDATAPHAREPEWPGCRDEIINLGAFWNAQKLVEKRAEIIRKGLLKRSHFTTAFQYFGAAKGLDDVMEERSGRLDLPWPDELTSVKRELAVKPGHVRHLFASALTPDGYRSHLLDLLDDVRNRYILAGPRSSGQGTYLQEIADYLEVLGYDLEVFHYPLNPKKYLHLFVPSLNLAILTALPEEPLEELDGIWLRWDWKKENKDLQRGDQALLEALVQRGIEELEKARASHGDVEHYYAQAMDFEAASVYRQQILAEILAYKNRS